MKTIRLAENDIDLYRFELINLLKQSYQINFPTKTFTEEYFLNRIHSLKSYINQEKAIALAVKNYDELMGFIWFFKKENENTLHINSIVVSERYRNKGVGRVLWNEAESYARNNNINEIELIVTNENESAVNFYKKRDFQVDRLFMKKRL